MTPSHDNMGKIQLFNLNIDNYNLSEATNKIEEYLRTAKFHCVGFLNTANIYYLKNDKEFIEFNKSADMILADGISVVWASRLFQKSLKGRVTGPDLFLSLLELANRRKDKIFILKGSNQDKSQKLRNAILKKFQNIIISGIHSIPYDFNIDRDTEKNSEALNNIKAAAPDILFVSLGSPKGKKWIWRNRSSLSHIPLCIEIGAATDYIMGTKRRAPQWMQKVGIEWIYRLSCEPLRLWKRYFLSNSYFLIALIKEAIHNTRSKEK
tara:strand:- start:1999 stop:2796 length:798 start_codon:yes stop_codon:yes gene_type:complete